METYIELNQTFLSICEELENNNFEVEEQLYDLEEQATDSLGFTYDREHAMIEQLLKKIKSAKLEYDLYDEEAELDNMFPDRHDDDFDEDSMSHDSVFGED
jgi:hypothetical protein